MEDVKDQGAAQVAAGPAQSAVVGSVVTVCDEPDANGAHHHYRISPCNAAGEPTEELGRFARVQFQKGPVGEAGVNGCANEDLLGIVMHRLASFQNGPYACPENGVALQHVQGALHWLQQRTLDRQARGVEGQNAA